MCGASAEPKSKIHKVDLQAEMNRRSLQIRVSTRCRTGSAVQVVNLSMLKVGPTSTTKFGVDTVLEQTRGIDNIPGGGIN